MKPLEELRRENADTWRMVIEKLRAMGHWVVVEYAGVAASHSIVSAQAVPADRAADIAYQTAKVADSTHSVAILPPTRAPVRTLGEYVRECAERAERDLPITYGGTE